MRFCRAFGFEVDLGAVRPAASTLRGFAVAPHEDAAGDAVERGRVRGALGGVAGRPRDDAARLLVCRERRELREHAARLERARALEELGLEIRLGADPLGQRA